jgi:hypothetical protein
MSQRFQLLRIIFPQFRVLTVPDGQGLQAGCRAVQGKSKYRQVLQFGEMCCSGTTTRSAILWIQPNKNDPKCGLQATLWQIS